MISDPCSSLRFSVAEALGLSFAYMLRTLAISEDVWDKTEIDFDRMEQEADETVTEDRISVEHAARNAPRSQAPALDRRIITVILFSMAQVSSDTVSISIATPYLVPVKSGVNQPTLSAKAIGESFPSAS